MEEARVILNKHIQKFYSKNPNARFEDIPEKTFINAMIEYGNIIKSKK